MKNEKIKIITSEDYFGQLKNATGNKTALDLYLETLIDEFVPSARNKIARYIFKFEPSSSLDTVLSLTVEFKDEVLNDYLGGCASRLSFNDEELIHKVHVNATKPKYFIGTEEYKDRVHAEKIKRKLYKSDYLIRITESGSYYVNGYDLYRCCDACYDFFTWMSEELEPFQEGVDFIRTYNEDDFFVYILTLPTAISIISNTDDFCFGEEYRKDLINKLRSKLEAKS